MSNFDFDNYLKHKLSDVTDDKTSSVAIASAQKTSELAAFSAAINVRAAEYTANKEMAATAAANSTIGRLGLEPDSILGAGLNAAVSLGSGATMAIGMLSALPHTIDGALRNQTVNQSIKDARTRELNNQATPADNLLLGKVDKHGITNRDNIANMEQAFSRANYIKDSFDISSAVNNTSKDGFTGDLGKAVKGDLASVSGGWDAIWGKDSSLLDRATGVKDIAVGALSAAPEIAKGAITHPLATVDFLAENIPNTLAGAAGKIPMLINLLGYGGDTFAQGVQAHRDTHQGAMPTDEDLAWKAAISATAVGAEYLGQMSMGVNKLGKLIEGVNPLAAVPKATIAETTSAFKTALSKVANNGIVKTAGAVAEGGTEEFATEAYQTWAENAVKGKETTIDESFMGGAIGAVVGGVTSGGTHAVAEITHSTPTDKAARAAKIEEYKAYKEAVKTGDVAAMADPENIAFNPLKALSILTDRSSQTTATPEVKIENLATSDKILSRLDDEYSNRERAFDVLKQGAKGVETATTELAVLKTKLEAAPATDTKLIATLNTGIKMRETVIEMSQEAGGIKGQQLKLDAMKKDLDTGYAIQNKLIDNKNRGEVAADKVDHLTEANKTVDPVDTKAVAAAQASITVLINRSMSSSSSRGALTHEQASALADNPDNALTAPQRNYLRVFSKARQAENALRDIDSVSNEIYAGSIDNKGIAQHRMGIERAIASGNQELADHKMDMLLNFAIGHTDKATVSNLALDDAQKNNRPVQVVIEQGKWRIVKPAETPLTPKEMAAGGFVTARPKPTDPTKNYNSEAMIRRMPVEAAALNALVEEKQAAYDLRFTPVSTIPSTVVPAVTASNPSVNPLVTPPSTVVAPSPTPAATPVAQTPAAPASVAPANISTPHTEAVNWMITKANEKIEKHKEMLSSDSAKNFTNPDSFIANQKAEIVKQEAELARLEGLRNTTPDPQQASQAVSKLLKAKHNSPEHWEAVEALKSFPEVYVAIKKITDQYFAVNSVNKPAIKEIMNKVLSDHNLKLIDEEKQKLMDSGISEKNATTISQLKAENDSLFASMQDRPETGPEAEAAVGHKNAQIAANTTVINNLMGTAKAKAAETTATSVGEAVAPVAGVVEAAVTPDIPSTTSPTETTNVKTTEAQQAESQQATQEAKPTVDLKQTALFENEERIKQLEDSLLAEQKSLDAAGKFRRRVYRKNMSLWSALKGKLSAVDLNKVYSTDAKRYNLLKDKTARPTAAHLQDMIDSGSLNAFLPMDTAHAINEGLEYDSQVAYEHIVEKLVDANYLSTESQMLLDSLDVSVKQLEDNIDFLIQELSNEHLIKDSTATQDSGTNSQGNPQPAEEKSEGNTAPPVAEEAANGTEESTPLAEAITEESPKETPEALGTLGLFSQFQDKLNTATGVMYTKLNLVAQFFKQSGITEGAVSQKALVAVKDFLTTWHVSPKGFIAKVLGHIKGDGQVLTTEQRAALTNFKNTLYGVEKGGFMIGGWIDGVTAAYSKTTVLSDADYALWSAAQIEYKKQFVKKGTRVTARDSGTAYVLPETLSIKDLMQGFFIEGAEQADTEENVKTAIMTAAYKALVDAMSASMLTSESIIKMHSQGKNTRIDPRGEAELQTYSAFLDTTISSLGKTAVQALGVTAKDSNTPLDLLPRLESALGAHALELLVREGYVEVVKRNYAEINSLFYVWEKGVKVPATPLKNISDKVTLNYVKFAPATNAINTLAVGVKDANKGSKDVIGKLFGLEKSTLIPSDKPTAFTQKTTKNTNQKVPSLQTKVAQATQQIPHTAIIEMHQMLFKLGRDSVLRIMGHQRIDEESPDIHRSNRPSIQAQNRNLEDQYDKLMELFDAHGLTQEFYVAVSIWLNNRSGFKDQTMNLQTSKLSRALFTRPSWKTEIKFSDEKLTKEFLIAVAMGMGSKTDQRLNAETLAREYDLVNGVYLFKDADILAAANSIKNSLKEPESSEFTSSEIENISSVTSKEGVMSLQTLTAYAQYLLAHETKEANSFKFTMLTGADGKTNGPMLTLLALGAATYEDFNRGGMYSTDKGQAKHFSEYYGKQGAMDLYQNYGDVTLNHMESRKVSSEEAANYDMYAKRGVKGQPSVFTQEHLDALQLLTGNLRDGSKIGKAMRDMVKTPLTAFFFSSTVQRAVAGMTSDFISKYATTLENIKQSKAKDITLDSFTNALNTLIQLGGSDNFIQFDSIEKAMETNLRYDQEAALSIAFNKIMGESVAATLKSKFSVLINRRDSLNRTINSIYDVYAVAYHAAKATEIQRLMAKGTLAPRTNKEGVLIPLRDLTEKEDSALRKTLRSLLPIVHTDYSLQDNSLQSGMMMMQSVLDKSDSAIYDSESAMLRAETRTIEQLGSRAHYYTMAPPGVAGLPYLMHSLDSSLMFQTIDEHPDTLNNHDETSHGVAQIADVATSINKATVTTLLRYSPTREAANALYRSIIAMAKLAGMGIIPATTVTQLLESWADGHNKYAGEDAQVSSLEVGGFLLENAASNAYSADRVRLETISKMAFMDQYTWEGGSFEVTPEIRAKAEAELAALVKGVPSEVIAAMGILTETSSSSQHSNSSEGAFTVRYTVGGPLITSEHGTFHEQHLTDGLSGLIATGVQLGEALQAIKGKYPKFAQDAENLGAVAAFTLLNGEERAEILQAITEVGAQLASIVTPFGVVGSPFVESDSRLLQMFDEHNGELTLTAAVDNLLGMHHNKFYTQMLKMIRAIDHKFKTNVVLKMVTPESKLGTDVTDSAHMDARGWYVVSEIADSKKLRKEIYILNPEFEHSGLTVELLLHEMFHAVLSGVITRAQKDSPKSEAALMVKNLEDLRKAAIKYVGKNSEFNAALGDIHEFVSWGTTNHQFQKEVLMKMPPVTDPKRGKFLTAMHQLIDAITNLFLGQHKKPQDTANMSMFIANVTGLMQDAKDNGLGDKHLKNMAMAATSTGTATTSYATTDIFDALHPEVSTAFGTHLRGLLSNITEKLHGISGSLREAIMKDSPKDALGVFTDSLYTGKLPFASQLYVANIKVSDQEAFVMDQVEATTTATLAITGGDVWAVRKELSTLYHEMKNRITPAELQKSGMTQDEAEGVYAAVFNQGVSDKNGTSDYLSRFMAMGLGHEAFNKMLQVPTSKSAPVKDSKTVVDKLKSIFGKILTSINGRVTNTKEGQRADLKLESLLRTLVSIETKKAAALSATTPDWMDWADKAKISLRTKKRGLLNYLSEATFLKESAYPAVSLVGHAIHIYSAPGRVKYLFAAMDKFRNAHFSGVQGVANSLLTTLNGPKASLETMLRAAKKLQTLRQALIDQTDSGLLDSFDAAGANLTTRDKSALTNVLVRSGAHVLLDHYSLAEIAELVKDSSKLDAAIATFRSKLTVYSSDHMHFFLKQANALGYNLATGKTSIHWLLRNASNIAHMYGSPFEGNLTTAEHANATEAIDVLTTLYALLYNDSKNMEAVGKIMDKENTRGGENGANMVLLTHKQLDSQSKERLFDGTQSLMLKGYTSDIYDPHTDVKTATLTEGVVLERMGYVKDTEVSIDPTDIYGTEDRFLYVLKDGGLMPRVSGLISFTNASAKGTKVHGNTPAGFRTQAKIIASKQQMIADLHKPDYTFDPRLAPTNHTVPLLNDTGIAVNFVYLMHNKTKDLLLDRDNSFNAVLGAHAGSIFDKEESPKVNKEVVEVLFKEYDEGFTADPKAFVEISANSPIPEYREIYRMLPQKTKDSIKEAWGRDAMMVRSNAIDIVFGYSKFSLSNMFYRDADDRNYIEDSFVRVTKFILKQYAQVKLRMNDTQAEEYAEQAGVRVRRAENVWQALVHETKDILVVKTGLTLLGNELSNKSLLWLYKVPVKDIVMNTKTAWEAADAHQTMSKKLFTLQSHLERGYITGDTSEITREIGRLKGELATNPVTPLIEAGLMPSIVEDLASNDDTYSRKSKFVRDTKKWTDKINTTVKSGLDQLYMTHDTTTYKTLSHLTQLSDFTARYVLYQHLTTRKDAPMSHDEAAQEASTAFINYDIPLHRGVQWLDDMGLLMFTKYALNIQRVIRDRFIENPGRALLLITAHSYFNWIPSVMSSSMFATSYGSTLHAGALGLPFVLDKTLVAKMALSPFR